MGVKKNITTGLIILLIIANAISIALFWFKKDNAALDHKGGPARFIINELKLSASQQRDYLVLVSEHQQAVQSIRGDVKQAKDDFFKLLDQPNAPDSLKQAAAKKVSLYTEKIDLITLEHFAKLRALCNSEQKKKVSLIMKEVTHMMAAPPMHPGPPPSFPPDR